MTDNNNKKSIGENITDAIEEIADVCLSSRNRDKIFKEEEN